MKSDELDMITFSLEQLGLIYIRKRGTEDEEYQSTPFCKWLTVNKLLEAFVYGSKKDKINIYKRFEEFELNKGN